MKKMQSIFLTMLYRLRVFLQLPESIAITSTNLPFTTAQGKVFGYITDIENLNTEQQEDTTWATNQKNILRTALINLTIQVADRIYAYGLVAKVSDILTKAKITERTLSREKDIDIAGPVDTIIILGTKYLANLLPYGVDQNLLDSLDDAKTAYLSFLGTQSELVKKAKDATDDLVTVFDNVKIELATMDSLVNIFEAGHPDFVSEYHLNREVPDAPVLPLAISGKVIDAVSKLPLYKAKIVLQETEEERSSSEKGNFRYQNSPEGLLHLEVSLPNYLTQIFDVEKMPGITSKVTLELMKG